MCLVNQLACWMKIEDAQSMHMLVNMELILKTISVFASHILQVPVCCSWEILFIDCLSSLSSSIGATWKISAICSSRDMVISVIPLSIFENAGIEIPSLVAISDWPHPWFCLSLFMLFKSFFIENISNLRISLSQGVYKRKKNHMGLSISKKMELYSKISFPRANGRWICWGSVPVISPDISIQSPACTRYAIIRLSINIVLPVLVSLNLDKKTNPSICSIITTLFEHLYFLAIFCCFSLLTIG